VAANMLNVAAIGFVFFMGGNTCVRFCSRSLISAYKKRGDESVLLGTCLIDDDEC